jgi:hypothetical protein
MMVVVGGVSLRVFGLDWKVDRIEESHVVSMPPTHSHNTPRPHPHTHIHRSSTGRP